MGKNDLNKKIRRETSPLSKDVNTLNGDLIDPEIKKSSEPKEKLAGE